MINYDKYTLAGTDEQYRLLFVFNAPSKIDVVNEWHKLFLWSCSKITLQGFGKHYATPESDNIMRWDDWFTKRDYPGLTPLFTFMFSTGSGSNIDNEKPFAVILYERSETLPYKDELAKIQASCEDIFYKMYCAQETITSYKLLTLLSSTRKKKVEAAKNELAEYTAEANALLNRLFEIRSELLDE